MPEKEKKYPCRDSLQDVLLEGYVKFAVLRNQNHEPYDFRFLKVNAQFEKIAGISCAAVAGKTLKQFLNSSTENWDAVLESLRGDEGVTEFEYVFELNHRYFQVRAFYPSEDVIVALFLEVTAKKKAEDALKIHKVLFENAQDIILYVDKNGNIVDSNQRALEEYGCTKEQLLKKTIQEIRHPSTLLDYERQMRQAEAEGVVFESLHQRSDGTYFPVEVSVKGTQTGSGTLRIHIIRDITKRKEQEERIAWLARYDSLTGIQNRGSFIVHLEQEIQRVNRSGGQFAVMLFDIDKFKQINDRYGHEAGDLVLRHVAARVGEALRVTDQFGRFGGDEFVVLQTEVIELGDVAHLAERIQEAASVPVTYHGISLRVSVSIGICLFPGDAGDTDSLLLYADKAMYRAKKDGGSAYSFFAELEAEAAPEKKQAGGARKPAGALV